MLDKISTVVWYISAVVGLLAGAFAFFAGYGDALVFTAAGIACLAMASKEDRK